jgi:hypothetical protein
LLLGAAWAVMMVALAFQLPTPSQWVAWISLFFPVYYTILSLALHARRRRALPNLK